MTAVLAVTAVLLVAAALAVIYARAVKRARKTKADIKAALAAGKSLLYSSAAELRLNGEGVEGRPGVSVRRERGLFLDPGPYESIGTYTIRDDEGKLIATFSDAELKFSLKGGKEYELGVFLFDAEILGHAVAHRQLGPSGSGQGILALACVAC
ncbi:MAG: hypothetical protein LBW85_06615 [Deltaproteobacteria bacterium]|jgi:hypothetical protein|nr:hypothetical protein [Deltaproteobacteria bacterium]